MLALGVAAVVQFGVVAAPVDGDTAYHVAVGRLIRAHGILQEFPWTPFSWLADHYGDKELLLHLMFAALGDVDWSLSSKIVGTLLGGLLLTGLYLVLRAERVALAALWALLPLAATDVFLYRFALVRPHLLSIPLALAVLWAAARGRLGILAALSVAYPFCYVAWGLPLALVAAAEAARFLAGQRPRWQPAAAVVAGLAAGLLLHPNTVNLVKFSWVVLVDVLWKAAWGARPGLELGLEFEPFTVRQWLEWLLAVAALLAGGAVIAWRVRKRDPVPLALALAGLGFLALTLRTARFAEYLVPFAVATFAVALARLDPPARWARAAPAVVLLACLGYTGRDQLETIRGLGSREDQVPRGLAQKLQARIPEGAQVFTCDWGATGKLMLALPERRFLVALDPTLFYLKDPVLSDLWYRLPREAPPGVAEVIRRRFGARFVACFWDQRLRRFFDRIAFEDGVQTIHLDDYWNVYDLGPPRG
ncbi:MAG: hypothetical protein HZB56_23310 [Deltaproteobacteria bacterium]|nr:hypothetical protein [Deltaproteobacteria bacterium]